LNFFRVWVVVSGSRFDPGSVVVVVIWVFKISKNCVGVLLMVAPLVPRFCFGVIYGYGRGCFQAWFGWLCFGVAPLALGLGDFSGGVVVLASPVMWGVVARCLCWGVGCDESGMSVVVTTTMDLSWRWRGVWWRGVGSDVYGWYRVCWVFYDTWFSDRLQICWDLHDSFVSLWWFPNLPRFVGFLYLVELYCTGVDC
jgi:hypothetical protein